MDNLDQSLNDSVRHKHNHRVARVAVKVVSLIDAILDSAQDIEPLGRHNLTSN